MGAFDPISALIGGVLIGLASALLMLLNGRIAGISGILGGALTMSAGDKIWRLSFIAGLIAAPIIIGALGHPLPEPSGLNVRHKRLAERIGGRRRCKHADAGEVRNELA